MIKKRVLAMALLAAMTLSAVGCSNSGAASAGDEGSVAASDGGSTVGGDGSEAVPDLGELTIINMGSEPAFDMDADYYPILDELTAKWGFKARIHYVAWGEEGTTLQTRVAGGDYDAVTVGPWSNYTGLAQSGYFKDLSGFLDDVPDLCEAYGGKEELLKLSIDGRGLCYIPQRASGANSNGFWYRKDLCDELGVEPVTDLESLNAYLYAAKDYFGRPMLYTPDIVYYVSSMMYDSTGLSVSGVTTLQSDPYTPVVICETEGFKKAMEQAVTWFEDGVTSPDVMNSNALPDVGNELMAGTMPCHFANHLASGMVNFIPQAMSQLNTIDGVEDAAGENPNGIEFDFMPYLTDTANIYEANNGDTTGFAINAKCTDEETAALMKFIEACHTDVDFFDQYQYGKQGVSYNSFSDEDGHRYVNYDGIDANNRMYRKLATGLTDEILARSEKLQYDELQTLFDAKSDELQERLVANPLNGFIFDPTNVSNQVMAVNEAASAVASYNAGIIGDLTVDEAIEDMKTRMYDAGLQDIIDELQVQLDAYKEKNNIE